jgi:hypothetical protein
MPIFQDSIPFKMLFFEQKLQDVSEGWSDIKVIETEALILLNAFRSQFSSSWTDITDSYLTKK